MKDTIFRRYTSIHNLAGLQEVTFLRFPPHNLSHLTCSYCGCWEI